MHNILHIMWSKLIRQRREINELTQTELAVRAGVSLPSIQNMEAGRANPSLKTLEAVFQIIGVEIFYSVKDLSTPSGPIKSTSKHKVKTEKPGPEPKLTPETEPQESNSQNSQNSQKSQVLEKEESLLDDIQGLAKGSAKERIGSLFKIIEKVTDKK